MPSALPIDNLIRPKVWMARCPAVRVLDQRVEMFQKGAWWMPLLVMIVLSPLMAFVATWAAFPQPFLTLFKGMACLMLLAGIILSWWWRREKPILVFHRDKASLSVPGHRLFIPVSALEQFRIREVLCPDADGGPYVTAVLVFETPSPRESRCIYLWNPKKLEPAWKHFQAEVQKMMQGPMVAE